MTGQRSDSIGRTVLQTVAQKCIRYLRRSAASRFRDDVTIHCKNFRHAPDQIFKSVRADNIYSICRPYAEIPVAVVKSRAFDFPQVAPRCNVNSIKLENIVNSCVQDKIALKCAETYTNSVVGISATSKVVLTTIIFSTTLFSQTLPVN